MQILIFSPPSSAPPPNSAAGPVHKALFGRTSPRFVAGVPRSSRNSSFVLRISKIPQPTTHEDLSEVALRGSKKESLFEGGSRNPLELGQPSMIVTAVQRVRAQRSVSRRKRRSRGDRKTSFPFCQVSTEPRV